jgi:hypothetical protein
LSGYYLFDTQWQFTYLSAIESAAPTPARAEVTIPKYLSTCHSVAQIPFTGAVEPKRLARQVKGGQTFCPGSDNVALYKIVTDFIEKQDHEQLGYHSYFIA